jgi:hypothetical protein
MEKYVYIKINRDGFAGPDLTVDVVAYRTGTAWTDYENGAWLLLTPAQVAFRDVYPLALKREVFEIKLAPPPVRTIEQAKAEKVMAIDMYDSEAVNRFYLKPDAETVIPCRFDAQQRAMYQTSINSRGTLTGKGIANNAAIRLPVVGQMVVLPLDNVDSMLAVLQNCADEAYNVTYLYKAAVLQLTGIAAVDACDRTPGYPEKPAFTL